MNERELLQSAYRYALSLTGESGEAEDLAQQGWLRLLRRYGQVPRRGSLFLTVRRLFIDRKRRDRRVEFVPLENVDAEPSVPPVPTLERLDLERLLGELRPKEREALYLHAVEGYTATEIAGLTKQGRGTVLSLIHRARKKLAAGAEQAAAGRQAGGSA
ncbi:MAG: RNA polymerase sigma factor [Acidobacteriota bacterium]